MMENENLFNVKSAPYIHEAERLMTKQEYLFHGEQMGWITTDEVEKQHSQYQDRLNYCRQVIDNMHREFCAPMPADYSADF